MSEQQEGAAQGGASAGEAPDADARSAVLLAVKNGFTMGGAMLLTAALGLAMKVVIPRHLGPTDFGSLNFADNFTATLFVLLGLGMDTHIRKEAAVHPEIVSRFWGGAFVVRSVLAVVLMGVIGVVLHRTHRADDVTLAAYLYALTQFCITANWSLGAMLQAKGKVAGSSLLSVTTKVVWVVGVVISTLTNAGLWAYAASYFASEAIEVVALWWLARRHLGLTFRVDVPETVKMLRASLPYSVVAIATSAYGTLGSSLLEFSAGSTEVGFYGVVSTLASMTLMVSPIIGWVLAPMLARAADRDHKELFEHVCRSLEVILSLAIPASMLLNLGADQVIVLVFGAKYSHSMVALRVLSTTFVLTYVAIIYSTVLVMLERAWMLTWISLAGLAINAVLNVLLVPYALRLQGEGGGGTGAATAMLGTELFVTVALALSIGRGAFDRRGLSTVARSLGVYGAVAVAHHFMGPIGPVRLVADGVLYLVLAVVVGALRPRELVSTVREAMRGRKERKGGGAGGAGAAGEAGKGAAAPAAP